MEKITQTVGETKTIESIEAEIKKLQLLLKPTETNRNQFEKNCRVTFYTGILMKNYQYLMQWKGNIGKMVFKYINRENYSEIPNPDHFNKTQENDILFTEQSFLNLKVSMLNYWIQYHTEILLNTPTQSSTSKFSNLQFEWELEERANLIRYYRTLLNDLGNDFMKLLR